MIDNTYGFIILRHVRNFKDNQMWISCYNSIRKFYSNKIIIIKFFKLPFISNGSNLLIFFFIFYLKTFFFY